MKLIVLALLLASCGKQVVVTKGDTLTFKSLADVKCPPGQYIERVTAVEWMNGEIRHYVADCVRVGQ